MSVRRQTANRLTLFRTCGTCGKQIVTTADTPWVRQVERDGKKQATPRHTSALRAASRPAISTSAGLTARPRSAGS